MDELDQHAAAVAAKESQRTWRVRQTIEIEVTAPTVADAHTMWRHEVRRRVLADPMDGWGISECQAWCTSEPDTGPPPWARTATVTR